MTRKQKRMLVRIIVSAVIVAVLLLVKIDVNRYIKLALWLVPYFIIGYNILWEAVCGIGKGQIFDENFLMTVATLGALALAVWGKGDYFEAVAVMLFYQIGELFQSCALGKSRKSIGALMDIRPDFARVERNGELVTLPPEEVQVGEIIVVDPGERVAIDGVVVDGESDLDTSALTGESIPREAVEGTEVLSASINISAPLRIKTTKPYGESAVSRILDLVENASSRKSQSEKFISRFAKIYTPAVCAAALILAVFPPLLLTLNGADAQWEEWIYRALSFLVVSCPCALVISIPMGFFASLGGASRDGILVKGSSYLEAFSKVGCIAFDKTGTLTQGKFEVAEIYAEDSDREKLLEYAAHAECASSHPIAKSLQRAYGKPIDRNRVSDICETRGHGVEACVDGVTISVNNIVPENAERKFEGVGTVIYVRKDGKYAGYIVIRDSLREGAKETLATLRREKIRTVMLTGDCESVGRAIADEVGVDEAHCGLLPDQKVSELEKLISTKSKVAFVGDGINDAPVLAIADIGIAMGGIGSDAATDAADIVIMDDDISKVAKAVKLSKKCVRIARENIIFSIGVKLCCLLMIALGIAGMNVAIFADVGVLVIAVINSMRGLY